MIALIIVALLASRAGLGVSVPREAYAAVVGLASTGEPSVDRAHGTPFEPRGAARRTFLRGTAPAISRVQTPSGAHGADGSRAAAHGATLAGLELGTRPASGQLAAVTPRGATAPGQPAPSSRAPPFG